MRKKVVHVVTGEALDETVILRLRPIIESYVSDEKEFSTTELNWWMTKDEKFGYKIKFIK